MRVEPGGGSSTVPTPGTAVNPPSASLVAPWERLPWKCPIERQEEPVLYPGSQYGGRPMKIPLENSLRAIFFSAHPLSFFCLAISLFFLFSSLFYLFHFYLFTFYALGTRSLFLPR